jgi:hypothetical protein
MGDPALSAAVHSKTAQKLNMLRRIPIFALLFGGLAFDPAQKLFKPDRETSGDCGSALWPVGRHDDREAIGVWAGTGDRDSCLDVLLSGI